MTTPRPTVRELAAELRVLGDAAFVALRPESARFITDALLGSNLPLDAPYYPEPQKFMAPKPQSAVGDYTWNHQKGDWEVKEINHWKPGLGPVNCQKVLRWEANKPYPRTCERCGLGPCPFWREDGSNTSIIPSSPPTGVNAGRGLKDGAVTGYCSLGDECQCQNFTQAYREKCVYWHSPPSIPTSASTAGAVEELAACPFDAASGDEVSVYTEAGAEGSTDWFVRCHVCCVETARQDTKSEAIAAWNRRVSPASATIARLKGALGPFAKFAPPAYVPDSHPMTQGSPLAKTQVTAADFRRAAQALADLAGEG